MNFEELEVLVQEKEKEARKSLIARLQDAARGIALDSILDIVEHETILSKHPRINREGDKIRIAILQVPSLRGKYYVSIEDDNLGLFREGYEDPLSSYKEERIRITYDYIKKHFWS